MKKEVIEKVLNSFEIEFDFLEVEAIKYIYENVRGINGKSKKEIRNYLFMEFTKTEEGVEKCFESLNQKGLTIETKREGKTKVSFEAWFLNKLFVES